MPAPNAPSRLNLALSFVLVAANLIVLNVLIAGLTLRVDLTENGDYTVSPATRQVLAGLSDRVIVHAYLSKDTHPKLAPLIPKIADLLEEYRIHGHGQVVLDIVDPRDDEAAEKEAFERFGVKATPFRLLTKYESAVRSAYFDVVVQYGDRHLKLDWEQIVEVRATATDVEVDLKDLEYPLTAAIKKVSSDVPSMASLFARLQQPIEVFVFATKPARIPERLPQLREYLEKRTQAVQDVAKELAAASNGKLRLVIEDPEDNPARAEEIARSYGIGPLSAGLFTDVSFYLDALVRYGERAARINIQDLAEQELSAADLRDSLETALKRVVPGMVKTVGLVTPTPAMAPEMMGMRQPPDVFRSLRGALEADFEVRDVSLKDGRPPGDVDVLLIAAPHDFGEKERYALDQYVMYGGRVVLLLDRTELDLNAVDGLSLKPVDSGLDELLAHWGVTSEARLLLDDRSVPYPLPVRRDLGGVMVETVESVPYPYFPLVAGDGLSREHAATAQLEVVGLFWPAPLTVAEKRPVGQKAAVLLASSPKAWVSDAIADVAPKFDQNGPIVPQAPPDARGRALAVAIEGELESFFKGKPVPSGLGETERTEDEPLGEPGDEDVPDESPPAGAEPAPAGAAPTAPAADPPPPPPAEPAADAGAAPPKGKSEPPAAPTGTRTATVEATKKARIAIVGDADFVSEIGSSLMAEDFAENLAFLRNLIDWSLGEEALLGVRSRGTTVRPLETLTKGDKVLVESLNYAVPIVAVLLFGILRLVLRRRTAAAAAAGRRPTASAEGR